MEIVQKHTITRKSSTDDLSHKVTITGTHHSDQRHQGAQHYCMKSGNDKKAGNLDTWILNLQEAGDSCATCFRLEILQGLSSVPFLLGCPSHCCLRRCRHHRCHPCLLCFGTKFSSSRIYLLYIFCRSILAGLTKICMLPALLSGRPLGGAQTIAVVPASLRVGARG